MAVSDTLLKIKIWTKVTLLSLAAIYTALFLILNNGEKVSVWLFFGQEPRTSLVVALIAAFALGSLLTLLVRMVFTTVRQIRTSRDRTRSKMLEAEIKDMRQKTASLGKGEG